MRVHLTCAGCGASILRWPSQVTERNYCRRACMPPPQRPPVVVKYDQDGLTARIPLRYQDGRVKAYAVVDATDAEWVNQWYWSLSTLGYVVRDRGRIRLHRALLGLGRRGKSGDDVDHINRDKLDNRRANLRLDPDGDNPQNCPSHQGSTSAYRGVCWNRARGKWMAALRLKGQQIYLGHFNDEIEAAETVRAERLRLMPFAID